MVLRVFLAFGLFLAIDKTQGTVEDVCRNETPSGKLENSTFTSPARVSNFFQCVNLGNKLRKCKSINYNIRSRECWLNSGVIGDDFVNFEPDENFKYREICHSVKEKNVCSNCSDVELCVLVSGGRNAICLSNATTIGPPSSAATTMDHPANAATTMDPSANAATTMDASESTATTMDASGSAVTTIESSDSTGTTIDTSESAATSIDSSDSTSTSMDASDSAATSMDASHNAATIMDASDSTGTTIDSSESTESADCKSNKGKGNNKCKSNNGQGGKNKQIN